MVQAAVDEPRIPCLRYGECQNWWRAHLLTAIREELLKRGDKLSIVTLEQIADLIEILADTHVLHGRRVPHKLD